MLNGERDVRGESECDGRFHQACKRWHQVLGSKRQFNKVRTPFFQILVTKNVHMQNISGCVLPRSFVPLLCLQFRFAEQIEEKRSRVIGRPGRFRSISRFGSENTDQAPIHTNTNGVIKFKLRRSKYLVRKG